MIRAITKVDAVVSVTTLYIILLISFDSLYDMASIDITNSLLITSHHSPLIVLREVMDVRRFITHTGNFQASAATWVVYIHTNVFPETETPQTTRNPRLKIQTMNKNLLLIFLFYYSKSLVKIIHIFSRIVCMLWIWLKSLVKQYGNYSIDFASFEPKLHFFFIYSTVFAYYT